MPTPTPNPITPTTISRRAPKRHPARTVLAVAAIAAFAAGAPAWSFQYAGHSTTAATASSSASPTVRAATAAAAPAGTVTGGTVAGSAAVPVYGPTTTTANGVTTNSVETGGDPNTSTPRGVLTTPATTPGSINANGNYVYPTSNDDYPTNPTASASMPIKATPDTTSSGEAADRLRTGPVGAAANRASTTPTLTPDTSRQPLDCRTAGGKSIPCAPSE